MKIIQKILLIFFFIGLFSFFVGKVFASYPKPTNYVNDFANVLSPSFENKLNKKLSDFEKDTTNEVSVVTINSTGNVSIEEYANGLFTEWGIGKRVKNNGLLLLVAIQDRKMRFEVGRGLEGTITDIQAKNVLNEQIRPEFRASNYESGIEKGVNQILYEIDPKATESGIVKKEDPEDPGRDNATMVGTIGVIILVVILLMVIISMFESERNSDDDSGGGLGSLVTGGIIGGTIGSMIGSNDDSDGGSYGGFSGGDSDSGSSFGGFGGGNSSGGGASSGW